MLFDLSNSRPSDKLQDDPSLATPVTANKSGSDPQRAGPAPPPPPPF